MANAADDEGAGAIRVDIDGQLPQFLSAADVLAGIVTYPLEVRCLQLGELWVKCRAIQQDRRQRIGHVIVHEAAGALEFVNTPLGLQVQMRVGDRVDQAVVELVVDHHQQAGFGPEVVVERTGAQACTAGQAAEVDHATAAHKFLAGSIEKLLTSNWRACHHVILQNIIILCLGDVVSAEVSSLVNLAGDLAGTYRWTPSSGDSVDPAVADADLAMLRRDGYVILPDLLTADDLMEIREAVVPLLDLHGRNRFEGHTTQRVYSVLNKTRACDRIADHPRVLALLDRLFLPNYLLSMLQVINILPGEQAQMLHTDDGFYPIPRPRAALGAATIWAIDDFTADNGATDIIAGSHLWGDKTPKEADRTPVVMAAGSCVFFLGTLWHGGGANQSDSARLALTAQYCEPWLRPQEAFTLSMTRDTVRAVSEDIRRMLGYSIHPPFIGQVDGMHPKRLLEPEPHPI